jgi:tripartite-type tricarboxylate transporter receptor subunit TctC
MNKLQGDRLTQSPFFNGRRRLVKLAVALAGLWACVGPAPMALAQSTYPNRPIKIVVPYSAGTGSDVLARTVAQSITEKTGHTVIIENREGAGSLIGTLAVSKAAPDGYTIMIAAIPLVLVASPSLKINSVKELIAYAKANPGKLSYGTSGPGPSQNEMELFKQAVGIDILEIPYKSTAQAMTDLIGGQLPLFPAVGPLVLQHLQSGRATGLGVFDTRRSPQMPDLPSMMEEVSAPGYLATPVWYGFVAPAKTPPEVVAVPSGYIQTAMSAPETQAKLVTLGAQITSANSEQFANEIKNEYEKSAALSKKIGTLK